jgi:hypothetical protein
MAATPPEAAETDEREDRRGAPPGQFGNPPFVPTEEQREQARTLAKTFPPHGEHFIARLMGISRDTLRRHFADDMELGRAQMLASVGAQVINAAMDAESKTAKGDRDLQKYILARLGGWTTKVEMSGRDGRPVEVVDLTGLSASAIREYGRQAAIQAGLDPDETVGPPLDDE